MGRLRRPTASWPCQQHLDHPPRCHFSPCPRVPQRSAHCRLAQYRSAPSIPHSRNSAHAQTCSSSHLQPRVARLVQGGHGRNVLAQVHLSQLPPLQKGLPRLLQAPQKLLPALTLLPILETAPGELLNSPRLKSDKKERVSRKWCCCCCLPAAPGGGSEQSARRPAGAASHSPGRASRRRSTPSSSNARGWPGSLPLPGARAGSTCSPGRRRGWRGP